MENYLKHYFSFLPVSLSVSRSIGSLVHFTGKLFDFDGQDTFYSFQSCDNSNKLFPLEILTVGSLDFNVFSFPPTVKFRILKLHHYLTLNHVSPHFLSPCLTTCYFGLMASLIFLVQIFFHCHLMVFSEFIKTFEFSNFLQLYAQTHTNAHVWMHIQVLTFLFINKGHKVVREKELRTIYIWVLAEVCSRTHKIFSNCLGIVLKSLDAVLGETRRIGYF